ncbi:hypothetical protein AAH678_09570 [Sodalis endosymbiont of Spalangia cameroni]
MKKILSLTSRLHDFEDQVGPEILGAALQKKPVVKTAIGRPANGSF